VTVINLLVSMQALHFTCYNRVNPFHPGGFFWVYGFWGFLKMPKPPRQQKEFTKRMDFPYSP